MNTVKPFLIHTAQLDNAQHINARLLQGLQQYIDHQDTRKSHLFHGRYENIYIDVDKIPALQQIIDATLRLSSRILSAPYDSLKAGLWFNVMNPGDKTTLHRHDDDDELLSAVYYIQTPASSGELKLVKPPVSTIVTPQEGMFVFFPPSMPHEVTENLSEQSRISLGINIGPVEPGHDE